MSIDYLPGAAHHDGKVTSTILSPAQSMTALSVSPEYREAVKVALVLQICATALLLMILDGGVLAKVGAAAMLGFWIGVSLVMIRRPRNPSSFDLLYVRWGYIAMLLVGIACMPLVGTLRGS